MFVLTESESEFTSRTGLLETSFERTHNLRKIYFSKYHGLLKMLSYSPVCNSKTKRIPELLYNSLFNGFSKCVGALGSAKE